MQPIPFIASSHSNQRLSRLAVFVALLGVAASLSLASSATGSNNVLKGRYGLSGGSGSDTARNSHPTPGNYQADAQLFGSKWRLTHVGGTQIPTTKPYILLDGQSKRFQGDGGCNRMSGAFEVNASAVKFSQIISTKRACADRQLQLIETKFVENLGRTSSYYIKGDVMRLYAAGVAVLTFTTKPADLPAKPARRLLQANSLCEKGEQIVFSCRLKRPAKIVSLCASPDLEREQGYLQYRFGLPARIELEFPQSRQATQQQFQYTHYFRYQVDLTEINFSIEGNRYQIFDAYNGEEKPRVIQYGVMIVPPRRETVSYHCRTRPKADYSKLGDALREH